MGPVALLAGNQQETQILVGYLRDQLDVKLVVWEHSPRRKKISMAWRRLKRLGIWPNVDALAFKLYYRFFLATRDGQRKSDIFLKDLGDIDFYKQKAKQEDDLHVNSINDPKVMDALGSSAPAAVGVIGTSIIRPPVLGCVEAPMINIHAGWTPNYRGSHGAYWAVVENDIEHCGVTIHLVDSGIDTGGILRRDTIMPEADDNVYSLVAKQIVCGAVSFLKCLQLAAEGQLPSPIKEPTKGKLYYSPTLSSYVKFYKNLHKVGTMRGDYQ